MTKRMLMIPALLGALLAGCATTDAEQQSTAKDDCFYIRTVNNWSAIDDEHIYIEAAGKDQYLLTMKFRCSGIRFTNAIALSNRMGRVCPNDFGRITYRDGGMSASCRIDNVERVTSKEEATALVESRKSEQEQ